jgi:uncharacterized protein YecE (DUF72 family)
MTNFYLGTQGFSYVHWKGVFYPSGIPAREYLAHYSNIFNSVEMDTTFYAVPRLAIVQSWAAAVPDNFLFTAKTPQSITHEMGLANSSQFMDEFLNVMRVLGSKLGVILVQLPPSYTSDKLPILKAFLEILPDDIRFAVEFRHRTWFTPQTAELLSAHRIGWAATEFGNLPHEIIPTTDFLYIRWLGKRAAFRRYDQEQIDQTARLTWWKDQIFRNASQAQAVYGFFNNDYSGFAPGTCNRMKTLLDQPITVFRQPEQGRLF